MKYIIFLILHFPMFIFAQNDCGELLKYGIYNSISNISNSSNYQQTKRAITKAYDKYTADKDAGKIDGSYSIYSASAKYKGSEIEKMHKLMTKGDFSEISSETINSQYSNIISPEVVNAYVECRKLSKEDKGLEIIPSLNSEETTVTFDIRYKKHDFSKQEPILRGITIEPIDCFVCRDELMKMSEIADTIREDKIYSLTCTRNIRQTPIKVRGKDGEKSVYAEGGMIKIKTDMGNYTFWVSPIYSESYSQFRGVGEIVSSMLDPDLFTKIYGKNWVLANGETAPEGSKYAQLISNRIPDLRGVFLRGKNNGRPSGGNLVELPLGAYQADALQQHTHNESGHAPKRLENASSGAYEGKQAPAQTSGVVGANVAGETRPRNVTVNYFIKIN